MSIFKGAGVAIVTPMKENEEVNYGKVTGTDRMADRPGNRCDHHCRNDRREFHTDHGRAQ